MYKPTIEYDEAGYARVTAQGRALGVQVVWIENDRNAGGTYATDGYPYPYRVVWHEIQGGANPDSIKRHPYPPHVWYDPVRRILYQTVPLSRSAFALYQSATAPYFTNRARALQVELSGYSEAVANEPQVVLDNIAEDVLVPLCTWVHGRGVAPIDLSRIPDSWRIAGSAYVDAPQRFLPETWANWNGTCAHANVPMGDDHWDTGAMDIWHIAEHAAICIGALLEDQNPFPVPTPKEKPVPNYFTQVKGGTIYAIFNDGVWRDDYVWDEINALITHMGIKMFPVDSHPAAARKMVDFHDV